jgi:hypothetical protein
VRSTWDAINGPVTSSTKEEYVKEPEESPSERLQRLEFFWKFWRVEEYRDRKYKWNGEPSKLPYQINRPNDLPNGFEESGASTPLDERIPSAPVGIVRTIISRFTGLLFSVGRLPTISVPSDRDTEDFLNAVISETNLWARMVHARNLGGAMGAVAVGFKIADGDVVIDVVDPRYCTVEYSDHGKRALKYILIQYKYQKNVNDAPLHAEPGEDGEAPEERQTNSISKKWYWYRRLVTKSVDVVWEDIPCTDKEPEWHRLPRRRKAHSLGFVPYEYISNIPNGDETDGDPDCLGVYGLAMAIDALLSQAHYGVISNADPTLSIVTPDPDGMPPVMRKGSDNALIMGSGSSASYLEMGGQSLRTGLDMVKELEERAFRLAQCVPEAAMLNNQGDKTATEIERTFSSMLEKADMLRVQYGDAIVRLMRKLLLAVRKLEEVRTDPKTGMPYRERVNLPPRLETLPGGDAREVPRSPGQGTHLVLRWGKYFSPTLGDIATAIRVASSAKMDEFLAKEDCVRFIAPYLGMEATHILKELEREKKETEAKEAEESEDEETDIPEPQLPEKPSDSALKDGLVTINEYRMAIGLGPLPGGDLTLPQYRATNPGLFMAAELPTSKAMIDKVVAGQSVDALTQNAAEGMPPEEARFPEGEQEAEERPADIGTTNAPIEGQGPPGRGI